MPALHCKTLARAVLATFAVDLVANGGGMPANPWASPARLKGPKAATDPPPNRTPVAAAGGGGGPAEAGSGLKRKATAAEASPSGRSRKSRK